MNRTLGSRSSCRPRPRPHRFREGMTLLEVLLALAIFLGAVAVISEIVSTGTRAATQARFKSEAAQRCESVLNEVLAGVLPMQSVGNAPFEDDPQWNWSLSVVEGPHIDLLQVEVAVARTSQAGRPQAEFALMRWVRNPEVFLQTTTESETE